jgi:anti-sigma B factor antagonist
VRPPIDVEVTEIGDVAVASVSGRLTIGDPSDYVTDALQKLADAGKKKVVMVLNETPQIDSSGVGVLVRVSILFMRNGGKLVLAVRDGRVRDAITVNRLVEAIPTYDTVDAAVASFQPKDPRLVGGEEPRPVTSVVSPASEAPKPYVAEGTQTLRFNITFWVAVLLILASVVGGLIAIALKR